MSAENPMPKHVQAKLDEMKRLEEAYGRLRSMVAVTADDYRAGPFLIRAGVSYGNDPRPSAVFRVEIDCADWPGSTCQPTQAEITALLRAREHFDRWLCGEEEKPLPGPRAGG